MGRWLGVSHHVGSNMCYYILTKKGKVISRTTVQHVTNLEAQTTEIKQMIEAVDKSIHTKLNDNNFISPNEENVTSYVEDIPGDDEQVMVQDIALDIDTYTEDSYDELLNAELILPSGGQMQRGRVVKRLKNDEGIPIGVRNNNPILDSREYVVELADGTEQEFSANFIAENLYSQCDSEGRQHLMFQGIVDHAKDATAISKDNGFVFAKNGNRIPKKTTTGWKLMIEWKDGSTTWVPLKEVKSSNPIELAEYAGFKSTIRRTSICMVG